MQCYLFTFNSFPYPNTVRLSKKHYLFNSCRLFVLQNQYKTMNSFQINLFKSSGEIILISQYIPQKNKTSQCHLFPISCSPYINYNCVLVTIDCLRTCNTHFVCQAREQSLFISLQWKCSFWKSKRRNRKLCFCHQKVARQQRHAYSKAHEWVDEAEMHAVILWPFKVQILRTDLCFVILIKWQC